MERDLRVKKTKKLLFDAIFNLMLRRRFEQITVNEICEWAQISRATFYVHFEDKYDLMERWLISFVEDIYNKVKLIAPEKKEEYINMLAYEHKKIIENLLIGADNDTSEIIFGVICSFSNIHDEKRDKMDAEHVVITNIYAGGIISYLKWQVKNKFPKEVAIVNAHLYDLIKNFFA